MDVFDYLKNIESRPREVKKVEKKKEVIKESKIEEKKVVKEETMIDHVNLILGGCDFTPGKIQLSEGNDLDHINALLG
jgi:hypothetical protein